MIHYAPCRRPIGAGGEAGRVWGGCRAPAYGALTGAGYGLWPAGPAAAGGQRNQPRRIRQLRRTPPCRGQWRCPASPGFGATWRPIIGWLWRGWRTVVALFSRLVRLIWWVGAPGPSDGSRREFAAGRRTRRPSLCGVSWLRIRSGFEPIVKNEVKGHPLRFSGRQRFAGGMFIRVRHTTSPSAATCRPAVCRNSRLPVSERLSGARFPRSPDRASHWIWSACHWMAWSSS